MLYSWMLPLHRSTKITSKLGWTEKIPKHPNFPAMKLQFRSINKNIYLGGELRFWVNLNDHRFGDIFLIILFKLQKWLYDKTYSWHCCSCLTALQFACGSRSVFHCNLLFHRGLWGLWVIYVHTWGKNTLNSICTHQIFFLAQKLISHCAPSELYGTDIHFSKYGRYLRGEKKDKIELSIKNIWLWAENWAASGTPQEAWRTP